MAAVAAHCIALHCVAVPCSGHSCEDVFSFHGGASGHDTITALQSKNAVTTLPSKLRKKALKFPFWPDNCVVGKVVVTLPCNTFLGWKFMHLQKNRKKQRSHVFSPQKWSYCVLGLYYCLHPNHFSMISAVTTRDLLRFWFVRRNLVIPKHSSNTAVTSLTAVLF